LQDIYWIGSSKRDLMQMPDEVQSEVGFASISRSRVKSIRPQNLYADLALPEC